MMVSSADREVLVPNLLSLSRIPLAGLLWVAPREPAWTLSVLVVAGVTDVLDGWLVRRIRRQRVRDHDPGALAATVGRGAFIDGLADKVFVVSAIFVVAVTMHPPWWSLLVLALREIAFTPMMILYRMASHESRQRVDFTAGFVGKTATFAQFVALVLGLIDLPAFVPAAIVAGALGAVAALYYALRAAREPGRASARPRPAE